jgi:hypothetical protein
VVPPAAAQDSSLELQARSREVKFERGIDIEIRVPVSRPGAGYSASIELPEQISEVLVRLHDDEISLDHSKATLFVTLLKKAEGHLDVVGASGTVYRLLIRPVPGGIFDSFVLVRGSIPRAEPSEPRRRQTPEALNVMRAMRLSVVTDQIEAYAVDRVVFSDELVRASAVYVYESPGLVGYVVKLANLGDEALRVEPQRFAGASLVAMAAREYVLPPKKHTYLYFVFARAR